MLPSIPRTTPSRCTARMAIRPSTLWSAFFATPARPSSTRERARCTRSFRVSTRWVTARTVRSRSHCPPTNRTDGSGTRLIDLAGLAPWAGLAGAALGEADVVVAGIPYDGSEVYRKGAALAPQRIRSLSPVMPPVTEEGRLLRGLKVHDLGDLDAGEEIETGWKGVADRLAEVPPEVLLTVLGGDHCTAIATLAAQAKRHPGLAVLWVDAHPDLCDFSRGGNWTCGCALRRALDVSGLDPERVVIAGGRDYDPEELDFIAGHGILLVSARELAVDWRRSIQRIEHRLAGEKVHVSFDIDVLD